MIARNKKWGVVLLIYFFGSIISCCPGGGVITYETIETVRVSIFTFDENGVFPHYADYDINNLGVAVLSDSLSTRREVVMNYSTMDKAYACDDPDQLIYTNLIDSLEVVTVYDFDALHPAGSSVNDILLGIDSNGNTFPMDVGTAALLGHVYKFSVTPQNDSIQFHVSGRITTKGTFAKTTGLVVFN